MKKITILQIGLVLLLFFLASIDLNAQLKVGMNPKTLSSNIYLEVESIQGNKFIVTKDSAKVGIGTSNPSVKLEINNGNIPGAIKIIDGTEGVGKVLTSNASGVGTWNIPTVNTTNVTNSKDLINSNGIIVSGGIGATLQNTSLRLDSAAIAKMINQSPIKDSLLKVINSNTTVGSTFNVSTRVLTTTVNGVTSSVIIPNAVDSTTASNGLNLNGKDVRLGGTLTMPTTITQGSNLMTFTGTPSIGNTGILTLSNTATGSNGTVLLDMLTPNSDVSYYRLGKSTTFGNSAEITFRTVGNNSDSNSLSLGFFNSQYLLNLTKNGNLGIGTNLFVPTQKLDVDGGARIRSLASGAASDSIVTVDGTGVLRRRSLSAVVSGDNWGTQTVAVSAPLTGNGTSGSPLSITRANTTAANNLVTVTNGTNATFTAMTVGVDTTNLKSFLNNNIAVTSSSPLTGNGTSGSPLGISTNNTTAGQLVSISNGIGATLTNLQVSVDTSALKTFVNGRTTVSNTFNSSTRALTTTVNGVASNAITIPTSNDSTTASNGLTLSGKDVRLGGTLTMPTTITQGSNLITFTGTPSIGNTGILTLSNTATGSNGTVLLDMLTPNSDVSYYRLGKSTTFGNSAEITFRTVGNNSDSNSLSLGFFNSQYLLNLTKNGNLGIGANLFVPTQKLDVDGGARIRSLASGATSDSIVTVDGSGVLRRRSLSAVVSGDNWGIQTVAVSAPLTGNGTSGSPLNITRANTSAANNLVTVNNGTNATFTAMTVGVDTTNLKSFLNNNIAVTSSAPLTGNGTSGSPLGISTNNTTAGQLVSISNGIGATLTNMQVSVDTSALKTFVNGRTTVSNTFNSSTRALTTTVNGVASNAITIPTSNDSTTASNGLTLNGKDVRLGGTLNTSTTITQGTNTMTFTGTPSTGNSSILTLNNTATGSNGTVLLDMLTPNSDVSYYRLGKSTTFGNSAEITFRTVGNNSDSNSLSLGFFNSQYLLNLTKNGNLGIGSNLFIPSQKLDVDGGARIRNIASGAASDSIVTVDANGVLRKRNISAVVTGDNWGTQTVAVSAPLTGNGTSGSPLGISTNNTTAGQLVSISNGTGATLTNMQVSVDTSALKTFVNGRTTNTLTASSNSISNTTNGVAATLTPSAGTLSTKFLGFDASGNLVTDTAITSIVNIYNSDGTLTGNRTVTQGGNSLTFNTTPTTDYTAGVNIYNNAIGNPGVTILNMISPNSDTSFYRIGKSISTGNVAEISYTHRGTNNDTNRLSFGFHSSRYLLNLMKNGNLSVGNIIATEKLDVDGGARIRNLGVGASSDSIVTVDGNGVLKRRNINSVLSGATTNILSSTTNTMTNTTNGVSASASIINSNVLSVSGNTISSTINGVASNSATLSNIYTADGTLTGERTVTNNGNVLNFVGSGPSGFPIRLKSAQATSSEISLGIYDRNSDTKGWMIGSNTYNGVANANGNLSRELHFATLGFANSGVKMKIDSAGYMAVGRNVDPAVRLAIQGGLSLGNGNFLPDTAYYRDDNFVTFRHNGTSEDFIGYRNNTIYFADCPGGSDIANPTVMVLGNLGVGNTTPAAKLHVTGNARITSMSNGASTDSVVVVDVNGELKKRDPLSIGSANQLSASLTATVPALSIGDVGSVTVTLNGASVGDAVIVNPNSDLPAGVVISYSRVSATNTIKIGFSGTGSSSSFSQTFDIKVIK